MADPYTLPIEHRLILSALDFVNTVPALAALALRQRDEDDEMTPDGEAPKRPRLVISVADAGRTVRAGHVPIRSLRLELQVRANAKTPAGKADTFAVICGELEKLLDESNLKEALDSEQQAIAVMLATRVPGVGFAVHGDLRMQTYVLECKAVRRELTV